VGPKETLVQRDITLNKSNVNDDAQLNLAALCVKLKILCFLIILGVDNNICSFKNMTVFHLVSALVIVDIIILILDKRMSVKVKDTDESTPLHISAASGNLEAMNIFVERGAALSNVKKYGVTTLMAVAQIGKW